ncbi:MAG TPA: glycoside hydrolase family 3 C-terminal domain-containing protein [Clostridia bacterium]|nr:glycoside hydrolase family 3 C-terminal domain-containing protein [Clostridia bacterium]
MDKNFNQLLSQMTLEEKASLCSGLSFWLTEPIERLDIPSVMMTDGPHGLRKEVASAATNIMKDSEPATCFPPAATTASSWDPSLVKEIGNAIADEAKQLGVSTVLGPGVNIKRSPLCGRNFEYFSEDPYLAGEMGAAWVHGVQEKNVGVSLKHFCANNQEHIRMSIDSIVDERALREIYLPAFEKIVKQEQPSTVMCSYNRLNGTYLSDNKRMLTDILRDEWGFKGIVVSDWGAVNNRVKGIKAGLDLEMPGNGGMNDRNIVKAVNEGKLLESDLDKVVLRVLKFVYECKEHEVADYKADYEKNHELARKVAAESAVLLKNDGALPLKENESIAVIGALAEKLRYQGAGSSHIHTTKLVSFLDHLNSLNKEYTYSAGYNFKKDGYSKSLIAKAVEAAKGKDKVIVFVGLTDVYESEGFDRKHINMPESHNALIEELLKVNQNIVVVLNGGSPIKVSLWASKVRAILDVYLGGQAGGSATYDVLYGAVNPSGKLAETFPFRNHDNVVSRYFPMGPRTVEYRESIYVGYRFFEAADKPVQYPFGFGLSYTTFEYSDLKLSNDKITEGENLKVSFVIKNTGNVDGAEVAQLYVADKESTLFRPKKELKGFKKVFLKVGESVKVELELDDRSFAYYNTAISNWHIESGDFDILVGASSADIKLSATVNVTSKNPDAKIPDYRDCSPYYYNPSEVEMPQKRIPHEQFEAIYGAHMIENTPFQKGEFTINNTVEQIAVTGLGKFIFRIIFYGSKLFSGNSENSLMIQESSRDMPLRSFSGFTGGLFSQMSVDGLKDMLNGTKGGWKKFKKGFKKENK